MKIGTLRNASLVIVLGLAGTAPGQEEVAPGARAPAATAPRPAPAASATFRDVIRLHEAGLSDDFILRKIGREGIVYRLSTDDIIACKAAGLPEPIIEAMLKTAAGTEPEAPVPPRPAPETAAPVPPAPAPAVPPPAAASPTTTPAAAAVVPATPPAAIDASSLAGQADRSWDGMVRRAPGVVLFRPPWEPGRVSFREEKLSWLDASAEEKSVALPASEIREHFLVCPKDSESDADCFEWGVKTADGEYRFRDAGWEKARSAKPLELFEFLRAVYPDLATAKYRAKKR